MKTNKYILEKTYVLNKKYGKPNSFISYNHWCFFSDDSLYYLLYYYEPEKFKTLKDITTKKSETEIVHVCKNEDDVTTCRKNMQNAVKEKLGYTFTEKELADLDFSGIFKLNKELNGYQRYEIKSSEKQ